MKRILSVCLTCALLLGMLPLPALALEPDSEGLCPHHTEHSYEVCGCMEAVEGQPCGYDCRICPVQEMLDALPDTEDIAAGNRAGAEAQLAAIDGARAELTDEEAGELNTSRYQAVVSALEALDEQAGAEVPVPAADPPAEQFPTLTPGSTYWFDLSGAGIPETVNSKVPDTTLHWVPFTYVGTINAYNLTSAQATTEEYANQNKYDHSLFIADYNVTIEVSWYELNDRDMIFGTAYASSGVGYTMRVPSEGSASTGSGSSKRGTPQSNEWDMILNKSGKYIKNWGNMSSWGQDTYAGDSWYRAYRGYYSALFCNYYIASYRNAVVGFRPVLEIPAPDALTSGLRVVTLDLNGGKAGTTSTAQNGPVNIVVKSGESFTAPSGEGLTVPAGKPAFSGWKGDDGVLYSAGDHVPSTVTTLTARWGPDLADADITLSSSRFTYNGQAQTPAVTVTLDDKTLVQGTDYTVSYSDNTNAGTATVTATGTGIYSDMVTKSFEIAPKEITAALTGTTSKTYDGTMNPPAGLSTGMM